MRYTQWNVHSLALQYRVNRSHRSFRSRCVMPVQSQYSGEYLEYINPGVWNSRERGWPTEEASRVPFQVLRAPDMDHLENFQLGKDLLSRRCTAGSSAISRSSLRIIKLACLCTVANGLLNIRTSSRMCAVGRKINGETRARDGTRAFRL